MTINVWPVLKTCTHAHSILYYCHCQTWVKDHAQWGVVLVGSLGHGPLPLTHACCKRLSDWALEVFKKLVNLGGAWAELYHIWVVISQSSAPATFTFRFQIFCSISTLERLRGEWGRKLRPNFALFAPVKITWTRCLSRTLVYMPLMSGCRAPPPHRELRFGKKSTTKLEALDIRQAP